MDDRIHFIAGLPRSGSTLLSAILRQNPRLHAGITSPVAGLFQKLLVGMGASSDYYDLIDESHRRSILRSLFDGYYYDQPTKIVFDTNRYWCSRMSALVQLFPTAKVVCCVRDPVWILDSFERLVQRNAFSVSKLFDKQNSNTVHLRVEALASGTGAVGFAYNALQEAFYGEHADRLILLDYEAFTKNPEHSLNVLYSELKLPRFVHDFENVRYADGGEFDDRLGVPGLHYVTGPVKYTERRTILPPDLVQKFSNRRFWLGHEQEFVTVIRPMSTTIGKVKAVS